MKNIIAILLLLPLITFGSILEPFFIGKKFTISYTGQNQEPKWFELKPNNQTDSHYRWWIADNYLYIMDSFHTYVFCISEGVYGGDNGLSLKRGSVYDRYNTQKLFWNNISTVATALRQSKDFVLVTYDVGQLLKDLVNNPSLFQSWDECIDYYAEDKLRSWQKKGEFEKIADHKKRLNQDSINNMKAEFSKEAIDYYKKKAVSSVSKEDISLNQYEAELEVFPIKISDFGNFNLPVPISKARSFKENFKGSALSNLDFDLVNGEFTVSYFEIDGFTYNSSGEKLRYDENGALIK